MRPLMLVALLVSFLPMSENINAADIGECGTPEQMTAKFKAENQRSIAAAELLTNDKRLLGMIFTTNADRSVGYILQSDQPTGERANKLCVYNRMTNIRLFDARKPGTPPDVLLKTSDTEALKRCDELAKTGKFARRACGSLNRMIRLSEPHGERVMIQGFTVEKLPDGTYKPDGALVTISGNVNGSLKDDPQHPANGIIGSIVYSSLPDGASVVNATLVYAEYTEFGLSVLR